MSGIIQIITPFGRDWRVTAPRQGEPDRDGGADGAASRAIAATSTVRSTSAVIMTSRRG